MILNETLKCDLPCTDVNKDFILSHPNIDPPGIRLVMISEAPTTDHEDYFYVNQDGAFFRNTQAAFLVGRGISILKITP